MRTPEVEAAMKRSVTDTELVETKTPPWNRETLASVDRRTLAAEIERLEAETARLRAHLQRLLDWGAEIDPHASEPAKVRYAADVATIKPALAETKEGKEA